MPFLIRCASRADLHRDRVLQLSLEIIWALTFNDQICRMLIDEQKRFLEHLRTDVIRSEDAGVQSAVQGILWRLDNGTSRATAPALIDEDHLHYDLMISYSHANKDLCLQLYEHLTQLNFRVWLDLENMFGSTIHAMATAIESSSIILVCMSQSYKQSAYCRSEAEYAFTRQRKIIPLLMENKYRPDGWLGLICASKLYVDFTKQTFDAAANKLLSQIEHHRREKPSTSTKQEPIEHSTVTSKAREPKETPSLIDTTLASPKERLSTRTRTFEQRHIECWTHEDVLEFLRTNEFDLLEYSFQEETNFTGRCLFTLYRQSQLDPRATFECLNNQVHHLHNDHISYLTFIRFLTELHRHAHPIDLGFFVRRFFSILCTKVRQVFVQRRARQ